MFGYLLASLMLFVTVNLLSVAIYPERNDMNMFPADVLMFENEV